MSDDLKEIICQDADLWARTMAEILRLTREKEAGGKEAGHGVHAVDTKQK